MLLQRLLSQSVNSNIIDNCGVVVTMPVATVSQQQCSVDDECVVAAPVVSVSQQQCSVNDECVVAVPVVSVSQQQCCVDDECVVAAPVVSVSQQQCGAASDRARGKHIDTRRRSGDRGTRQGQR